MNFEFDDVHQLPPRASNSNTAYLPDPRSSSPDSHRTNPSMSITCPYPATPALALASSLASFLAAFLMLLAFATQIALLAEVRHLMSGVAGGADTSTAAGALSVRKCTWRGS